MSTINKTWSFATDTQGWSATLDVNGGVSSKWQSLDTSTGDPGGCLEMTQNGSIVSILTNTNYWEITGTWENLFGIPPNSTVTQIGTPDDYDWRCSTFNIGGAGSFTGPFELHDGSGSLIATLSNFLGFSATSSWATLAGSSASVPGSIQPSNSTIKLRLKNTLNVPRNASSQIILRQDKISVTITYSTSGGGGGGGNSNQSNQGGGGTLINNQFKASTPLNSSGLTAMAMQVAGDFWGWKADVALDEVFPGTWNWLMDGAHDIIWSFSAKRGFGSTRIMKTQWNLNVPEMQYSATPLSGFTNIPRGVGGPSVAQSWRDSQQNPEQISLSQPNISVGLIETFLSGATRAFVGSVGFLPTQNRWRGTVDNETILFEGTSGGLNFPGHAKFGVDVVYRAIDGTLPADHANQSIISQDCPNTTYGVNSVKFEKMQFVYPDSWTSGGIQGVAVVPQIQTVFVFAGSGVVLNGWPHFSGMVMPYDPTTSPPWGAAEFVWVVPRNKIIGAQCCMNSQGQTTIVPDGTSCPANYTPVPLSTCNNPPPINAVLSGQAYDGQLVGYSASGAVAPVYAVDNLPFLVSGQQQQINCCLGFDGTTTLVAGPCPGNTIPVDQSLCTNQVNCCTQSLGGGTSTLVNGPCPPGTFPIPIQQCVPKPPQTNCCFTSLSIPPVLTTGPCSPPSFSVPLQFCQPNPPKTQCCKDTAGSSFILVNGPCPPDHPIPTNLNDCVPPPSDVNCCKDSQGGFTLVNGPCPDGTTPSDLTNCQGGNLRFNDSCSISWPPNINQPGGTNNIQPFWKGMCVYGQDTNFQLTPFCGNSCIFPIIPNTMSFPKTDSIFFNKCDFSVTLDQSCCKDVNTIGVAVRTEGYNFSVTVLDENCNPISLCFLHGLLKNVI